MDETCRFRFFADLQSLLLPPLVLDQCKLYQKQSIPWAFFTWAKVSDDVHARLCSGVNKLAPHEWNSGPHVWIIDSIAPFGGLDECLADLRASNLAGDKVHALAPQEKAAVQIWPATAAN
ncbi:toxin-activating lysine-acyltransferase [Massilia sp. W12]|uniref:toxin-activating lysine-acyltransferase n=1 Tax=Massilia sp. W12 TaxID=3126507 RepID=UPI0030D4CA49